MKILLTGGLGFIGKKFLQKYYEKYELIIIAKQDKRISSSIRNKSKIIIGSILEKDTIKNIILIKPDIIIHLGALTGLKNCQENKDEAYNVNVNGTKNIIDACIKSNSKLIFISTREVYGEIKNTESKEEDELNPMNVYGKTKKIAEELIENAGNKHDLSYMILRPTNVYGPSGLSGINNIIIRAIEKQKLQINGGNQILNFLFIDDLIEIIHYIAIAQNQPVKILNIGSNDTCSLNDFIKILSRVLGYNLEIEYTKKPNFESEFFKPDLKKMFKLLSNKTMTSLEDGLKKSVKMRSEIS